MKNLRKLIRETLERSVIFEDAKEFINFGPNVGLVIKNQSSEQIWLNFFDFNLKECVGVITLRKITNDTWSVTTVAAKDGFGPLMYKSGMMAVYPNKVCPDKFGTPSNKAINVWYKFYLNSGELKKEAIPEDSQAFKDYGDEDKNIFLNFSYSRPQSTMFKKFLENGTRLMKEKNISIEGIRKICSDYFMKRYEEK